MRKVSIYTHFYGAANCARKSVECYSVTIKRNKLLLLKQKLKLSSIRTNDLFGRMGTAKKMRSSSSDVSGSESGSRIIYKSGSDMFGFSDPKVFKLIQELEERRHFPSFTERFDHLQKTELLRSLLYMDGAYLHVVASKKENGLLNID